MISKENIIEKIEVLLKELTTEFDHIKRSSNIHPLEFHLFEANANYFSEYTSILRKLEEETSENMEDIKLEKSEERNNAEKKEKNNLEKEAEAEDIYKQESEEIPEPKQEEQQEQKDEEPEEVVEPEKESSKDSEIVFTPPTDNEASEEKEFDVDKKANDAEKEDSEIEDEPEQTEEKIINEEPVKNVSEEPPNALEDKVVKEVVIEEKSVDIAPDRPMSLNEKFLAQRKGTETFTQQRRTPQRIKDIKSAINLNDKLLFIKDLFNGYSLAYSEAIELLNRFESFDDAERFLQTNYAEKNNWHAKQASVDKLYAIIQKRYN